MTGQVLISSAELGEGRCKGFSATWQGEQVEGFLVRHQGEIHAYRNNCPHVRAPLDWMPDQFLDPCGEYIRCAMHGALFEIASGECVYGPCLGGRLKRLPIAVVDGEVLLVSGG